MGYDPVPYELSDATPPARLQRGEVSIDFIGDLHGLAHFSRAIVPRRFGAAPATRTFMR
jgi:hypothetical protein